jgi:hypothetical protein
MASGKRNPLNIDPDRDRGNVLICDTLEDADRHGVVIGRAVALGPAAAQAYREAGRDLYLSHFVTCPNRLEHRKR